MARLSYIAVVLNENGVATHHPLLSWVRNNTDSLPADFQTEVNSQTCKNNLVRLGWQVRIGENYLFVVKPDAQGGTSYADSIIKELDVELMDNESAVEGAQEMAFGLERDLQQAIRRNIQILEPGLQIIDDNKERQTEAGRIDITARDVQGRLVVIELKAPTAKPEVIAQTLAYMHALRVEEQADVRGIIVANDFAERVKMAAREVPSLKLVQYGFQFNFDQVD